MTRKHSDRDSAGFFRTALLRWFSRNRRSDPWRINATPYSIWIAEVMLQQTTVKTVIPFFVSWMQHFPDIKALASASEREVLRQWEGLGYYSRARNLHKTARLLVEAGDGELPSDFAKLTLLPGIGEYTASAILSIAFNKPYPVIDANVTRVIRRFLAITTENTATKSQIREFLLFAISTRKPGNFNEALMELGQTVCRSRRPLCEECPVRKKCRARALGVQSKIPAAKTVRLIRKSSVVFLLFNRGKLMLQNNMAGMFVGMWSLPKIAKTSRSAHQAVSVFMRREGIAAFEIVTILKTRTHSYTKHVDRLIPIVIFVDVANPPKGENLHWTRIENLDSHPLPAIHRKIVAELLDLRESNHRIRHQLF